MRCKYVRPGRQDWDVLRPYCLDDEAEWQELAESRVYIAGVRTLNPEP